MWVLQVVPAMLTLWLWTCTLIPTHVIDEVHIKTLTIEAPPTWPTITVLKTIGIPATSIDHRPLATSSSPLPPASRPTLDPYNYPPPPPEVPFFDEPTFIAVVLQECSFILSALEVPRYSILDLVKNTVFAIVAICAVLFFPFHLHNRWIRELAGHIRQLTINRIVRMFKQVCSCVNWALWELGHISILIGLIAGVTGYCTFETSFRFILGYTFFLTSFFKWRSFKQGVLRSVRLVVRSADAVKNWVAAPAIEWYQDRMDKKRIDKIFERPLSAISIGECLFPDLYHAVPNDPTFFDILKAMVTDLVFAAWNLAIFLIKLRIRSLMRIWPHVQESLTIIAVILFGADEEDLLWVTWKACLEYILRRIRRALDKAHELIERLLVSSRTWIPTSQLWLQYIMAAYRSARGKIRPQVIVRHKDSPSSRELGNKCVGYRQTIVELTSDVNYLRLLLCSVLNAHHNLVTGKKPNSPNAERPYQPSLIEFRTVPDKRTGLYIAYKDRTHQQDRDLDKEYRFNLKKLAIEVECNPMHTSQILKRHPHLPGKVPDGLDPFHKDHWVFSGAIPGLDVPAYNDINNPFDITAKRPRPVIRPEYFFGPQIEDFAARGELEKWGNPADPFVTEEMPKFTPWTDAELCKFKAEAMYGFQPSKLFPRYDPFEMALRGFPVDTRPKPSPNRNPPRYNFT